MMINCINRSALRRGFFLIALCLLLPAMSAMAGMITPTIHFTGVITEAEAHGDDGFADFFTELIPVGSTFTGKIGENADGAFAHLRFDNGTAGHAFGDSPTFSVERVGDGWSAIFRFFPGFEGVSDSAFGFEYHDGVNTFAASAFEAWVESMPGGFYQGHLTSFNATVPDGGATILLLGTGLLGLLTARRTWAGRGRNSNIRAVFDKPYEARRQPLAR
jgi:hypothetical protein